LRARSTGKIHEEALLDVKVVKTRDWCFRERGSREGNPKAALESKFPPHSA